MIDQTTQNNQEVKITAARGRPMLNWVGKRPITSIVCRPSQHLETYDPTNELANLPPNPNLWENWPSAYPKS
jgi:hypothetical protein